MKAKTRKPGKITELFNSALTVLFLTVLMSPFLACEREADEAMITDGVELKNLSCPTEGYIYYGPEVFYRRAWAPVNETRIIENPDYSCSRNFVLKIKNGYDKRTRVSSGEIRIDGVLIVGPWDFSKNTRYITKEICVLTPQSTLEVKLRSAPGSLIELWIEADQTIIQPIFNVIGPVEQYSEPPELPDVSENGITGSWSPETVDTSIPGLFSFVFLPDQGQCAISHVMVIEITEKKEVTDADGNIYPVVAIGPQVWMTENLKTTRYNNGELIETSDPLNLDISSESEPRYQWPCAGNEGNVPRYGRYYTWYTVTDPRRICPEGWHIPSDEEWQALTDFLTAGGYGFEGSGPDIAKSMASVSGWKEFSLPGYVGNDQASNNTSGFNAVPSGVRSLNGIVYNFRSYACWWSSTPETGDKAWFRGFNSSSRDVVRANGDMKNGAAVRCVKD